MGSWRVLPVLVAVVAGCATMRRHGDEAFERKSYVEAADYYDKALDEDPKDDKARAGRARARDAALTELLAGAGEARAQGHAPLARNQLARFFRLRKRWLMPTPPALVPAVEREATAAAAEVTAAIGPLLAADAPLAAEAALTAEAGVVDEPELAAARRKLHADITDAGRKRCEHYLADTVADDRAYWGSLVARYCRHFGRDAASPPLPYLAGGIDVDGAIAGMSAVSSAAIADRLRAVLAGTPWYAPGASERVGAQLRGAYTVGFQREPITLQAPWTERVSYTTSESRRVPHQVSRLETEHYTVQVPYTSYQTESYSCGTSRSYRTCSRSRSVTHYRTDHRTRSVTKWHTEYRTVWETVRRYRNVPRVFRYDAERHVGTYALASTLTVSLPPDGAPLQLPLARREAIEAVSHDVTFGAAGVEPQDGRLPSADEWLHANLAPVVERARMELRRGWQARFCERAQFTVEEAARCLHGKTPVAGATDGLRTVAGAEADALAAFAVAAHRPTASP